MALIYDEIRGWHVVDDKPDNPPADAYKPIIEGMEDGFDYEYNGKRWTQMVGRIMRSGDSPIVIDYSFDANQIKDEKNP